MRGSLSLAAGLAAACAVAAVSQACTDGTTPDCSDAQCLVVSVVEAGPDGAVGDAQANADGSGEDATGSLEAGPDAGLDSALDVGQSDAGDSGGPG
jgi:hypothetical protein